ncbi:MAG: riboflavin synthase [Betaproteobacteria bacterium]|jgi:riboflavin synthase|nr:riboflavin synthase [Betaproteobacteria bacterium]
MFTGIVQAVGNITAVTPLEAGVRLTVDAGALERSGIALGDSICVQGACLTVVSIDGARLAFDVSRETLACTVGLDAPGPVNLETSLALGDKLGGHLVTGHVDGLGAVLAFEPAGESKRLRLRVPKELARYVARKGSITVDGVSLTVNRVEDAVFEVNLIPHTLAVTTLARLAPGAKVNLEVDLIARYVERMLGND